MPQPQSSERARRPERATPPTIKLTSPAFADGARMPKRYTMDGDDVSPPLTWTGRPDGTDSFALVCEDPDAPSGLFVHWLIWNIDATEVMLPEDVPATLETEDGWRQGENSFGRIGWGGPSPPPGKPHRYVFRFYALDTTLEELPPNARRSAFDSAIEGHVLAETTLIGTYGRQRQK